jgi:hypothetical protein
MNAPIEVKWTPKFKPQNHEAHQNMIQSHKDAKQARREQHKRRGEWRNHPLTVLV